MIKKSLLVLALLTVLQADKIEFTNGAIIKGNITQKTATTVTIDIEGKITTYAMSDVKDIKEDVKIAPPPPAPVSKAPSTNTPLSIESGMVLHVRTTSSANTSQHRAGHQFTMVLESNLISKDGRVIAPKGSSVYATVVSSQQAGRLVGKSEMIVTLNAIEINGKRVAIKTQNINLLAPKSAGRDTVGKVAKGAAIGGLIDGSDGAKTGAKVGVGLAILTRGKSTGIPAGTLLDFTVTANTLVQ